MYPDTGIVIDGVILKFKVVASPIMVLENDAELIEITLGFRFVREYDCWLD